MLILLDVEGAEKKALEGATMMLRNDPKPIWLIEIAARENQPAGIEINPDFESTFEIFFNNGYQASSVDKAGLPLTKRDIELVSTGNLKLDSHNFIFRESEKI